MSTKERGYFVHSHLTYGDDIIGKLTTTPVIDRLTRKRIPKLPETFALGQTVYWSGKPYQVWAQHYQPRSWWLVDENGNATAAHDSHIRTEP